MSLIKILLIMSFVGVLLWGFRNRARVGLRASIRVGAFILTGAAIVSIINPDIPTTVANSLGVVRGTDLVLYVLIVVFTATSVGTYFRFREQESRLVEIVRAAAIRDALGVHCVRCGEALRDEDPHSQAEHHHSAIADHIPRR
jgi:hypothetical protein